MTRDPRPPVSRLSMAEAAALTFLAAGSVLVLEIAAARLLAPYVGVTLTTYTSIIGVILAGIALGAWLGGRAADALGPDRLLGPALALGGLAAIAAVPIASLLGSPLAGDGPDASLLLAAATFVAPAAILSAVPPILVRATIRDVETSGSLVGRLSAVGTVGALAGTFLTGYVLLGLVPVRGLVAGTGVVLALLGAVVALRLRGHRPATGLLALAAMGLATLAAGLPSPCQRESAYYCITVRADPARPGLRTLVLDDLLHARVDLDDPTNLEFDYVRWFAAASAELFPDAQGPGGAAPGPATAGRDALHVGGGGFSFPRYLLAIDPASRHTVLELDPVVLDTARRELGLGSDPRIEIRLGDARRTIRGLPDDAFDLVVGDAFGGRSVPWHLTTDEFLAEVDRVLRPGGRYVMNVIDGPALGFARAEAATLRARFGHLAVVTWTVVFDGAGGGNVVLVASHAPLDTATLAGRVGAGGGVEVLAERRAVDAFVAGSPVLRDDLAPVDRLIGG